MDDCPIMVITATTVEGADEDDFNRWYTDQHIGEVLALDGFLSAERFEIDRGKEGQQRYLTIYRIEPGKLDVARKALSEAGKSGAFSSHPGLDMNISRSWYTPIASRSRDGVAG